MPEKVNKEQLILDAALAWEPVIGQLAVLGVKSFHLIRALMQDAAVTDETIAEAQVKWDALSKKVHRLAE